MKNKFKPVINERTLRDFDRVARQSPFYEEDALVDAKVQRDPKGNKERDMRKKSKKDQWDD